MERGQRGGKFLKRGCSFYINNKLKSESQKCLITKRFIKNVFLGQLDRLGQFADVRSSLAKIRVVVFLRRVDTPTHTMLIS